MLIVKNGLLFEMQQFVDNTISFHNKKDGKTHYTY